MREPHSDGSVTSDIQAASKPSRTIDSGERLALHLNRNDSYEISTPSLASCLLRTYRRSVYDRTQTYRHFAHKAHMRNVSGAFGTFEKGLIMVVWNIFPPWTFWLISLIWCGPSKMKWTPLAWLLSDGSWNPTTLVHSLGVVMWLVEFFFFSLDSSSCRFAMSKDGINSWQWALLVPKTIDFCAVPNPMH